MPFSLSCLSSMIYLWNPMNHGDFPYNSKFKLRWSRASEISMIFYVDIWQYTPCVDNCWHLENIYITYWLYIHDYTWYVGKPEGTYRYLISILTCQYVKSLDVHLRYVKQLIIYLSPYIYTFIYIYIYMHLYIYIYYIPLSLIILYWTHPRLEHGMKHISIPWRPAIDSGPWQNDLPSCRIWMCANWSRTTKRPGWLLRRFAPERPLGDGMINDG